MKKIIILTILFATMSFAKFNTLNAIQVQEAIKKGIPVIDIRRADEWKQFGIIKGSHKLTFFNNRGQYDINTWMKAFTKIVPNKKQPFILVCAHANRTQAVGNFLSKKLKYENVNELKGGIMYGWLDIGLKTVK